MTYDSELTVSASNLKNLLTAKDYW